MPVCGCVLPEVSATCEVFETSTHAAGLCILIIAGTEDPVGGKTTTIQDLITRYVKKGHRALNYRFYACGRHELLNEAGKDRVHRDVGRWLSQILDRG
jgi:alpha-beta hydrolase superfamily lysophospholipase